VKISQVTDYPWSGEVKLTISPVAPTKFTVKVRIPGWSRGQPVPSDLYSYVSPEHPDLLLQVGGTAANRQTENGYVSITREWKSGSSVKLNFPMPVNQVQGNEKIAATRGQVAFERGPIVYCVEEVDQKIGAISLASPLKISTKVMPALLGGITELEIKDGAGTDLTAIPYYSWNNRGLAPMTVWMAKAK